MVYKTLHHCSDYSLDFALQDVVRFNKCYGRFNTPPPPGGCFARVSWGRGLGSGW